MTELAVRRRATELMDGDLPEDVYRQVLSDLARVNTLTLARRPTLAFLGRATKGLGSIRLLDVGFGYGDMLRRIARWCERRGLKAELVGVDLNPGSAAIARAATAPGAPIDYRTGDYAAFEDEPWDVVVSSLVAHHMEDAELVAFLRFMDRVARRGWFVNDLFRHPVAYVGFPVLARLGGFHPIVRLDGQTSIARAFRPADWRALLDAAAIRPGARVFRSFPFRLCVERLNRA
jgi:SAM-dependent methyltransferase